MRPLAGTEREFRILSSAIRRMISPAGKNICLLIYLQAGRREAESHAGTGAEPPLAGSAESHDR
jgi:hypothetical protein